MAWLVWFFLLYGDARSRNFLVPGSIYPTTLCPEIIWILRRLLLPTAGIEPGLPAQQVTALSITPLHLALVYLLYQDLLEQLERKNILFEQKSRHQKKSVTVFRIAKHFGFSRFKQLIVIAEKNLFWNLRSSSIFRKMWRPVIFIFLHSWLIRLGRLTSDVTDVTREAKCCFVGRFQLAS